MARTARDPNAPPLPPMQQRLDEVTNMLRGMLPYDAIQKQLSLKWGLSRTQIMGYIRKVHAGWSADAGLVAETRRHQIRQGFETLYMQARTDKRLDLAARILSELARLDGVIAPTNVNVNMGGQVGIGVGISLGSLGFKTPDEVKGRIIELQQKLKAEGPKLLAGTQAEAVAQAVLTQEPIPTNGVSAHEVGEDDGEPEVS